MKDLQSGRSPFDILESMTEWSPPEFWAVVDYLRAHGLIAETLQVFPSPIMYQTHESNSPYLLNLSCFLLRISNVATVKFIFSPEAEICNHFIWFKLWNPKVSCSQLTNSAKLAREAAHTLKQFAALGDVIWIINVMDVLLCKIIIQIIADFFKFLFRMTHVLISLKHILGFLLSSNRVIG